MKELIPKDEYGIFADKKDVIRVDSLFVAKLFEKKHKHVLRDIAKIIEPKSGLSENFIKNNFTVDTYKDSTGRSLPCYQLTRDGFTLLVMGYTGTKAMHFKEMYIQRFNEMENLIQSLISARQQFPLLTDNIKLAYPDTKPYHYSNECDMINRLVIGMTAKQFREKHNIPKGESIRPYLTEQEISIMDKLQKVDIGLLVILPDYNKRKEKLKEYMKRIIK